MLLYLEKELEQGFLAKQLNWFLFLLTFLVIIITF